jgi:hypothetical protein
VPVKRVVSRPLRRLLEPPDTVIWVWAGPPGLSLDERQVVLRGCAEALYGHGLTSVRLFRGFRRRLAAEGGQARQLLEAEAERAALKPDSWWRYDVCWSDADVTSHVVAEQDYDGNDLSFAGWGRRAKPALDDVVRVLDAHTRA